MASSSGTPSRRGVLFGSLAAAIALPAVAATEARPMSPVDAFITLMDGRDALTAAMELRGTEGGKRMRIRNLLPRYSDKAKTMTAALPAAAVAAFGEVVAEDGTTSLPPARMGTMEDILIGAKNLATLAAYVKEDRPFEDADIPQDTFAIAARAVDDLLASGARRMCVRPRRSDAGGFWRRRRTWTRCARSRRPPSATTSEPRDADARGVFFFWHFARRRARA